MEKFLNQTILDNRVENILWFLGISLVVFLFKRYLSNFLTGLLYRFFRRFTEESKLKRFNMLLLRPTSIFLVLIAMSISFRLLEYPAKWDITILSIRLKSALFKLTLVILALSFTWILLRIIDFISVAMKEKAELTASKMDDQLVPFLKDLMKVVVVIFSLFFILGGILQFNITSLLAGVGIGGLAIALAAQESLSNLFGSFTIFLDKPFTVGDLVKVGEVQGTVEAVGFRSTRIRTADKTFVTVPNKVMVDSYVDNFTLRTHRRVNMTIGLNYDTTPEQLKNIIADLQQYMDTHEMMNGNNYIRFSDFGESSLNLTIEYFYLEGDYMEFLKRKEEVNFKIMETVHKHNCRFAHPVRIIETKK